MRRIILLILLLIVGQGCIGGPARVHTTEVGEISSELEWRTVARDAITALDLGANERAEANASILRELRPHDPLPLYLMARANENMHDLATSLSHYEEILTSKEIDCSNKWYRLVSGHWVRARRLFQEQQISAALTRVETTAPQAGRCLVLPLEPMVFSDNSNQIEKTELELQVLGISIAAWVQAGLELIEGADPVDLHSAYHLRKRLAEIDEYRGTSPDGDSRSSGFIPPVTTILGIATRLARLTPTGPPPWDPEGNVPLHYLNIAPDGSWDDHKARALAHFQSENELPASGIIDPLTRRKLESAFRQPQPVNQTKAPLVGWSDSSSRMGQTLGAEAVLTGTLEMMSPEVVRWSAAWVSPYTGELLSDPMEGQLPNDNFEVAWSWMIDLIIQASPPCSGSSSCASPALIEAPGPLGARDYGFALLMVEEENGSEAVVSFQRAADRGVGERASWYAMAWSGSADDLSSIEKDLYDKSIIAPPLIDPGFIRARGLGLSAGLMRFSGGDQGAIGIAPSEGEAALHSRPSVVTFLPSTAWITITGTVEGQ